MDGKGDDTERRAGTRVTGSYKDCSTWTDKEADLGPATLWLLES